MGFWCRYFCRSLHRNLISFVCNKCFITEAMHSSRNTSTLVLRDRGECRALRRAATDGNCARYSLHSQLERCPAAEAQLWWPWATVCISRCWGEMRLHRLCAAGRRVGQRSGWKSGNLFLLEMFPTLFICISTQRKTIHVWMHVLLLSILNRKNTGIRNQGW